MKKKLTELFTSKKTSAVLFALAGVLLAGGVIGGVRAALSASSDDYTATMEMQEVGVDLLENAKAVPENGELMTDMIGEGESLKLGKAYDEALAVTNNSDTVSFVRVTLTTRWEDEDGKADMELDPTLIELGVAENSGWIKDEEASKDPEKTVFYYSTSLNPGDTTSDVINSITINKEIGSMIKTGDDNTFTYAYDGKYISLKADVDAVQYDSGQDAIRSAWGVDNVTVSGNSLTVN